LEIIFVFVEKDKMLLFIYLFFKFFLRKLLTVFYHQDHSLHPEDDLGDRKRSVICLYFIYLFLIASIIDF